MVPPWWGPPNVDIAASRHEAATVHWAHTLLTPAIPKIYPDGSTCAGEVGSAAYCRYPASGAVFESSAYLGTNATTNQHAAELAGIVLALRLTEDNPQLHRAVEILSDSQSALQALQNPRQSSGQYLIREAVRLLDWRRQQSWETRLCWIPSHWEEEIEGNRQADLLAKRATGWRPRGSQEPREKAPFLPGLPPKVMQSAAYRWIRQRVDQQWKDSWSNPGPGAPGQALRQVMPALQKRGIDLFTGLTTSQRSALIQARTGHIGFNAVLHRWGKVDSPICARCNRDPETTHHVILLCPEHAETRSLVWGGPQSVPRSLKEALCTPEHAKRTAQFLLATGRLTYLLPPPDIKTDSD